MAGYTYDMMMTTIADTDWTITAQTAEYVANGEAPDVARELADTQEAWLINHSRDALPRDWRYDGDGAFTGPTMTGLNMARMVDVIGSLQIEACDFTLQAQTLETLAQ